MKTINSFKIFKAIFFRQVKIIRCNALYIIYPSIYFIISLIIFRISTHYYSDFQNISRGIFFSLNIIVLAQNNPLIVERDYNTGMLENFYLTGCDLNLIILAKYLGHYLIYNIIFIPILFLSFIFLNLSFENIFNTFLIILIFNAIALIILMFSSCLLIGTQSSTLLSITILILVVPALIFAVLSLDNHAYMALSFALLLFLLPILTVCSKQLIIIAFDDKN